MRVPKKGENNNYYLSNIIFCMFCFYEYILFVRIVNKKVCVFKKGVNMIYIYFSD